MFRGTIQREVQHRKVYRTESGTVQKGDNTEKCTVNRGVQTQYRGYCSVSCDVQYKEATKHYINVTGL